MTVSFTCLLGATNLVISYLPYLLVKGATVQICRTLTNLIQFYYAFTIPETTPFHAGAVQKNVPRK
jgi:hypothetical protein